MDPSEESDLLRQEEEKQQFIQRFTRRCDDWQTHKAAIDTAYDHYRSIKENTEKLAEYFKRIEITQKDQLWPRLAEINLPANAHSLKEWLKFLGYINPHKSKKIVSERKTTKTTRKHFQVPELAQSGTYVLVSDTEGIGFPNFKKISKETGQSVW